MAPIWLGPRPMDTGTESKASAPRGGLTGLRVLIVEDDDANAKLMSVLLSTEGCELRVASTAEQALDIIPVFKPRLMIVDLVLPRMSGLLLAERLKADPANRDLVIVAVSVLSASTMQALATEAGCAAYVNKPVDTASFPSLLRRCLTG